MADNLVAGLAVMSHLVVGLKVTHLVAPSTSLEVTSSSTFQPDYPTSSPGPASSLPGSTSQGMNVEISSRIGLTSFVPRGLLYLYRAWSDR